VVVTIKALLLFSPPALSAVPHAIVLKTYVCSPLPISHVDGSASPDHGLSALRDHVTSFALTDHHPGTLLPQAFFRLSRNMPIMDKAFSMLSSSTPLTTLGMGWSDREVAVQWYVACATCLGIVNMRDPVFRKLPEMKGTYAEHAANRLAMGWGF